MDFRGYIPPELFIGAAFAIVLMTLAALVTYALTHIQIGWQ